MNACTYLYILKTRRINPKFKILYVWERRELSSVGIDRLLLIVLFGKYIFIKYNKGEMIYFGIFYTKFVVAVKNFQI